MSYQEFLTGYYLRPLANYPGYFITNKGRVWSEKTKKYLKRQGAVVTLSKDGKNKGITIWIELLKAFPDVEFTAKDMKRIGRNGKFKSRGVYSFPLGKKKWRAIISLGHYKKTIGYYKTKQEAQNEFNKAHLMLKGFKAW